MNWLERLFLVGVLLAAGAAGILALSVVGVKVPFLDNDRTYETEDEEGRSLRAPPPLPDDEGLLAELGGGRSWPDEPEALVDSTGFEEAPPGPTADGTTERDPTVGAAAIRPDDPDEPGRGVRDPMVDELKAGVDLTDPGQILAFLIATTTARGTKLGEEDLEFLLAALGDHKDSGLKNLVLTHLERIGGEQVTDGVLAFLAEEKNPYAQARALQTLRAQGDMKAVEGLVTFLGETNNGRLREIAFKNLLGTRSDSATQPLLDLLGGSSPMKTKAYALAALSQLGGERGAQTVLAFANSSNAAERNLGMKSLKDLKSKDAVPVLAAALSRTNTPAVKREVVRTLGRTRDARAVPAVANVALYDADRSMRYEAVRTLAQIGRAQAIPTLEVIASQDADARLRKAAQKTITVIQRTEARRAEMQARRR